MEKQLSKTPAIKDFTGMNIVNNIIYYREAVKRETNLEKRDVLQKRLDELKTELENYKAA